MTSHNLRLGCAESKLAAQKKQRPRHAAFAGWVENSGGGAIELQLLLVTLPQQFVEVVENVIYDGAIPCQLLPQGFPLLLGHRFVHKRAPLFKMNPEPLAER